LRQNPPGDDEKVRSFLQLTLIATLVLPATITQAQTARFTHAETIDVARSKSLKL
jgi:hypothetical protein